MPIYQIQTNEVPLLSLGTIAYLDFVELVKQGNRPERPDQAKAPQLTDALWRLAERCWQKDPASRPNANAICDDILHQLRDLESCSGRQDVQSQSPSTSTAPDAATTCPRSDDTSDPDCVFGSVSVRDDNDTVSDTDHQLTDDHHQQRRCECIYDLLPHDFTTSLSQPLV